MSIRYKYPRTPHLPWSPGATEDDIALLDTSRFEGQEVVITEKMDGENTTMYRDHVHARSVDSVQHPSRSWVKALQARVGPSIPEGFRVSGENLFAEHSIRYESLPSYFLVFSIWNAENHALSWDETIEWAALLDLPLVPVLYRGRWDEKHARALTRALDPTKQEGIVVRPATAFAWTELGTCVAKWVRPNHVTTDSHWLSQPVRPNGIRVPS